MKTRQGKGKEILTVKQLIDELNKIEDKNLPVIASDDDWILGICEVYISNNEQVILSSEYV